MAKAELGGHGIYIDWSTSNFVLSGIEYETEYLSRNVSSIMARLLHHNDLEKIIASSKVPVINGVVKDTIMSGPNRYLNYVRVRGFKFNTPCIRGSAI